MCCIARCYIGKCGVDWSHLHDVMHSATIRDCVLDQGGGVYPFFSFESCIRGCWKVFVPNIDKSITVGVRRYMLLSTTLTGLALQKGMAQRRCECGFHDYDLVSHIR